MDKGKHFSIRMDETTLEKFKFIAKYSDRSASGQIMYLINSCIRDFEREHGEITIDDMKKDEP